MIREMKPEYIAATFDLAGPTFRHEDFAGYKAKRVKAPQELYDQIALVKQVLVDFGVPIYEKQGYEADDLIGTLATRAKTENDLQIIIATGDLDTLQLVDGDKVVVFTLRRGVTDTVIYNEGAVFERYGLKPSQLSDYRGLKGDPSDNIPGVPGVGEKTASELIQKYGSLEKLYAKLEKDHGAGEKKKKEKEEGAIGDNLAEKLLENKDQAFFSKQLSVIVCDIEIDFSLEKAQWRTHVNVAKVAELFKEFGFESLIKRLDQIDLNGSGTAIPSNTSQASMDFAGTSKSSIPIREMRDDELDGLITQIDKIGKLSFDIQSGKLIVATTSDEVISVPLSRQVLEKMRRVFESPSIVKIGHDLKPIFKQFTRYGMVPAMPLFDTRLAAYMLNLNIPDYDFHQMYFHELGGTPSEEPALLPAYALTLAEHLEKKLIAQNLIKPFQEIELPLIGVLAQMELNGILVDGKILTTLLASTNKELSRLEKEIYKHAGMEFNINSPAQLGEVLFEKLGLKGKVRKTGGGALSTAASELEKLRDEHPIVDLVMQYREFQKLKSTYIEPFPTLIASDGRVHTTYNQTGTVTGRISSQDPNLQNIPIRTELGREFRKAFISEKGYKIVSCDYSQIDLRMVAHLAKDKTMIAAFKNGEDVHTRTAAQVFNVPLADVTKDMRRQAKTLNFGVLYGMGTLGFARAAGVNRTQAGEFIERYFTEFSGVKEYLEGSKERARKQGYLDTLFGHRRYFPDILSTMPMVRAQAERMAINMPVQGTAADVVKMAMLRVHDFITKERLNDDVRMLLQVHDELVFEIRDNRIAEITPKLKKIMESVHQFDVPLVVDVKAGENWEEVEKLP